MAAGSIVVVAKCPTPGKTKTRLIPRFNEDGAARLSKAMLSDVLSSISSYEPIKEVHKILFYAPGNDEGLQQMTTILAKLNLSDWHLIPMLSGDLRSSDLGAQLTHALQQARSRFGGDDDDEGGGGGSVVFVGMDSPELPLDEVAMALRRSGEATLCPAEDGGYGMLCVPAQAPDTLFQNMRWSDPLTAVCQIKALTDLGVTVKLGRLMRDIDEPQDVTDLIQRIQTQTSPTTAEEDVLLQPSSSGDIPRKVADCAFTKAALTEMGLFE